MTMTSATALSKTGANDDNVIFTSNEDEVARLDLQHQVLYAAMPKLIYAPIDLTKGDLRILDQATGSGIWLRTLRSLHPPTSPPNTYTGTDIATSYFPAPSSTPGDTSYYAHSMTQPWPPTSHSTFDLVHSRFALPGIGLTPLSSTVDNLLALVKPGGWIQFVEMEWGGWDAGSEMAVFNGVARRLLQTVTGGQGLDLGPKIRDILAERGWVDVGSEVFSVPVGWRAGDEDLRKLSLKSMRATVEGILDTMGKLGAREEGWEGLGERLEAELEREGGEFRASVVWGRRPGLA